jgi:uncharacterized protein
MIFVDTSFFVALFSKDDSLHERAILWSQHMDESLLTTEYVLVESVNYLSRGKSRTHASQLTDHVFSDPEIETVDATAALFREGMTLFRSRRDKNWSLTDCISFHLMKEFGLTRALTYDRHFAEAGFTAMLRHLP